MTPELVLLLALGTHQLAIKIEVHSTVQEVEIACRAQYRNLPIVPIDGCAIINKTHCTLHVAAPKTWKDKFHMERLGHELAHCLGAKH